MKSFASIVTNCFLKPIRKAKLSSIWRAQKFCFNIKHHHQRQERIWWRLPLYFVVFHSVIMALVELSFPIKRQELSNNLRIKEDSKIALRKKRRSAALYRPYRTGLETRVWWGLSSSHNPALFHAGASPGSRWCDWWNFGPAGDSWLVCGLRRWTRHSLWMR